MKGIRYLILLLNEQTADRNESPLFVLLPP
ncbi:hypothetical protein SAMN04489841_0319 [Natrinema salaciae]|uniref:Uncharacterized protein n=1 Tax=Natrinema salaciae TaxID=1186196 RepID=A0A1H9A0Y6_9EURY|nr:hypothetical protein SAMN04489841_0319 [Natrinema salaciae]